MGIMDKLISVSIVYTQFDFVDVRVNGELKYTGKSETLAHKVYKRYADKLVAQLGRTHADHNPNQRS